MKTFSVFILIFLALLVYFFFPFLQAPENSMETLVNRYGIVGASITRFDESDPSTVYFGYADKEDGISLDSSSLMRAESISKTIAAVALMHLIESHAITLDDPIYDHIDFRLEESPYDEDAITIRHILSHQSGITGGTAYDIPPFDIPSRESVLRGEHSLDKAVMVREAGEAFEYSNQAFILLEYLVEDVSGLPYETYVETHIFDPLSMDDSTYAYPDNLITSYDLSGDPVPPHRYPFSAPGGLYTTGEDLASMLRGLIDGSVISEESFDTMTEKAIEPSDFYALGSTGIGLGVFLDNEAVFHGGEGSGSLSQYMLYPEDEEAYIIMTNDKTAWEFIYTASARLSMSMDQPLPTMSVMMMGVASIIYGVIALLLTGMLFKLYTMKSTWKHLSPKAPTTKQIVSLMIPFVALTLWIGIRFLLLRNLIFTLTNQLTVILALFAITQAIYIIFENHNAELT